MAYARLARWLMVAVAATPGVSAFPPISQRQVDTVFAALREAAQAAAAAVPESPQTSHDFALEDSTTSWGGHVPRRPHVPDRFEAPFTMEQVYGGYTDGGKGRYAFDRSKKAVRENITSSGWGQYTRNVSLTSNYTRLTLGSRSFQLTGGNQDLVCRSWPVPGAFHDQFGWAANPGLSAFAGFRTVDGRPCSLWRMRGAERVGVEMSLCADGDVPVQLLVNASGTHLGGPFRFDLTFGDVSALGPAVDPRQFDEPAVCSSLAPPCPNARGLGPNLVEVYVFHPGISVADYDIADQDVADLAGDAYFICADTLDPNRNTSIIDHNYTRISRYSLLVSPAFGQYALCNGYPDTKPPGPFCFGGDPRLVGKEAPYFMGDGELRCAAESPVGFWYSLPRAGQCPPGERPGLESWHSGCTWSVQRRLKTLDQSCLLQAHRLADKCDADVSEGLGFTRSSQALRLAFASEDVLAGGCPDIGGPSEGPEATVVV